MAIEKPSPVGSDGRYFEDFVVGDVYEHPLGRTITATDNTWFTLLTMNTNQMHFNDHFASKSEFGRQLVNSGLTVAMVLGLSVSDISQNAIANLGWTDIKLLHPVFVDDTLYAESLITALRTSESRSHAGLVTCFTRGLNQHGDTVLTYTRTVMVNRRTADRHAAHFPTAKAPLASLTKHDEDT